MKFIIVAISVFFSLASFSQENNSYLNRLQAIVNTDAVFYNVDGIEITSQTFNSEFKEKDLKKVLRNFKIKKNDIKYSESELRVNNYVYDKSEILAENLKATIIYYILEQKSKVIVISFSYGQARNVDFEIQFINDYLENTIPKSAFVSMSTDSIAFAGRKIALGGNCRWMNIRSVQCPYYGQMNWSLHKNLDDAKKSIEYQFLSTKYRKGGKVISEEEVVIIFEGEPVTAKKVVYDITGVNSLLVGMSGAKTLTIYYVAKEVRGYFMSCVLSFWNNDQINESGLPALLEEVMQLKQ